MASYHHHHFHRHQNATTTDNCCCNCCAPHCTAPLNHPAPPPPTDPLLQALLSHLLLQEQQLLGGGTHKTQQKHHFHQQNRNFQQQQDLQEEQQAKFVLSSLLSRIDALETSLHNFSLSSAAHSKQYSSSCSLRDVAARVIQTHFRSFLVRRSRTLRQLKELALIKSSFTSLKLSVSKKPSLNYQDISRKAMDLLIKLDNIQGDDPMIRDGKRSISVDLVKFLEFVDGFVVQRREISSKATKNVRLVGKINRSRLLRSNHGGLGSGQHGIMERLSDRVEKMQGFSRFSERSEDEEVELEGFHQLIDDEEENHSICRNRNGVLLKRHVVGQPKASKSVSFAENGNAYRIYSNENVDEQNSSGDGTLTDNSASSEDNGLVMENEVEESEGLSLSEVTEDGENVLPSSDGARIHRRSLRNEERNEVSGDYEVEHGHFVFSAPLPVKMERADLMNKRKAVKFVT